MIASEDAARAYIRNGWGPAAYEKCQRLADALATENRRQNLVSAVSLASVWQRHIADSAQLLQHSAAGTGEWVDIGTGAGFPGLVIAMLAPERNVLLVEPRTKRVEWLRYAVQELALENCRVEPRKAEQVSLSSNAYVVSARAVAPMADLLQMTKHLFGRNTQGVFLKGKTVAEELAQLGPTERQRYVFHVKPSLTSSDSRIIVAQLR